MILIPLRTRHTRIGTRWSTLYGPSVRPGSPTMAHIACHAAAPPTPHNIITPTTSVAGQGVMLPICDPEIENCE